MNSMFYCLLEGNLYDSPDIIMFLLIATLLICHNSICKLNIGHRSNILRLLGLNIVRRRDKACLVSTEL